MPCPAAAPWPAAVHHHRTNDGSRMFKFSGGTALDEIVHAVNAVRHQAT